VHPAQIAHERDDRIKRLAGKIDRVLVDAPCSGLGTLRRNPDLKWRQSPEAVAELRQQQLSHPDQRGAAAQARRPPGLRHLQPAARTENEDVARPSRRSTAGLRAPAGGRGTGCRRMSLGLGAGRGRFLRLWPHRHGTDGFFAAVWQKALRRRPRAPEHTVSLRSPAPLPPAGRASTIAAVSGGQGWNSMEHLTIRCTTCRAVAGRPAGGRRLAGAGLHAGGTHVTIAAVTIFLHRAQAHRALELHPLPSHFFRFWLWLTTGMVTKEWVAIHRKHHAKCETVDDPHSPVTRGIRTVLLRGSELYRAEAKVQETLDKYGHNTPDDWIERHVYTRRAGRAWR
jgi:hypothetical protein